MSTPANLHLEIQTHRKNHYGLIRSSFRLDGKVQHSNHGRISGLPLDKLKLLQAAFRGQVIPKDSPNAFQILSSREYGASHALLQLAKELELPKVLYSRNEPWVGPALAMIVGRIVYAGSKLALSHQRKNTVLWELCGVEGKIDVDKHCYDVMDRLLERQPTIQRTLAKKHLQNGHLVLYDITSSYFEGEDPDSEIVTFGYNRDGKRGHEQMVIALLCNENGCPVGRGGGGLPGQHPGCQNRAGQNRSNSASLWHQPTDLCRRPGNDHTGQQPQAGGHQRIADHQRPDPSPDRGFAGT